MQVDGSSFEIPSIMAIPPDGGVDKSNASGNGGVDKSNGDSLLSRWFPLRVVFKFMEFVVDFPSSAIDIVVIGGVDSTVRCCDCKAYGKNSKSVSFLTKTQIMRKYVKK